MTDQKDEQSTQMPENISAPADSNNTQMGIDNPNPIPPAARKSKKTFLILTSVVLVLVLGGLLFAKSADKKSGAPITNNQPSSSIATQSATINITGKGFTPATIKIKQGQSVAWVNKDDKPHQVATDPYPSENGLEGFKSEQPQNRDETYSFTFDKSGTYTYHDRLNPFKFKGTVVVE